MEFPVEIWENILSNIKDPESLSFCRKTCYTFRVILNRQTYKIKNNTKKRFFLKRISSESFSQKNIIPLQKIPQKISQKKLKLEFLVSFPKLKICDYPLVIGKYDDFYDIYKFIKNSKRKMKITLKLEIDPSLFTIFLDSYSDILEETIFKIVDEYGISWITKNFYATYGSKDLDISDFNRIHICKCKHFISNFRLEKDFYLPSMESYTYLSSIDNLTPNDYEAPLFCKNYYWRPIKYEDRRKIDNLVSLSSSISFLSEVRPKIVNYEMPLLIKDIPKMKEVYFNCQSYRILHLDDFSYDFSDDLNEKYFYYSSKSGKKLEGIDLSNPPYGEKYIDNFLTDLI